MKNILVTGGSRGIGLEFTRQYLKMGQRVFAASRFPDKSKTLQEMKLAFNDRLSIYQLDVSVEDSRNRLFLKLSSEVGHLDILINNAGVAGGMPFEDFTVEELDKQLAVNIRGPFLLSRIAAPYLKESSKGRIVNVGSVIGLTSAVSDSSIGPVLSKSCVVPLTRYLAAALAPEILVNCIASAELNNL